MIAAAQRLRLLIDPFAVVVLIHHRHIRRYIRYIRRLIGEDYRVRDRYPAFHVHRYFLRAGQFQTRYQSTAGCNGIVAAAQGLRLLVDHRAIVVLVHH